MWERIKQRADDYVQARRYKAAHRILKSLYRHSAVQLEAVAVLEAQHKLSKAFRIRDGGPY